MSVLIRLLTASALWLSLSAAVNAQKLDALRRTIAADTAGSAEANYLLSEIFRNGYEGVTPNLDSAYYYLERAAQRKQPDALYLLGVATLRGVDERTRDPEAGLALIDEAANLGHAHALRMLSDYYNEPAEAPTKQRPNPTQRDPDKAFSYAILSARFGNPADAYNVAMAYATGQGTWQNSSEAMHWMETAAHALQYPRAQLTLAQWYVNGEGPTDYDPIRALYYFRLLANNPRSALEERAEGEAGFREMQDWFRRIYNIHLSLGFPQPTYAPALTPPR